MEQNQQGAEAPISEQQVDQVLTEAQEAQKASPEGSQEAAPSDVGQTAESVPGEQPDPNAESSENKTEPSAMENKPVDVAEQAPVEQDKPLVGEKVYQEQADAKLSPSGPGDAVAGLRHY